MSVPPIPEGFHSVNVYLVLPDVNRMVRFLEEAFDAQVDERILSTDGEQVMHAQVRVGDSMLMMGRVGPDNQAFTAMLYHYCEDCDAVYERAIAAGAESIMEPADMFYGDRHGGVVDPLGNTWWIATCKELIPSDELQKRAEQAERERGG